MSDNENTIMSPDYIPSGVNVDGQPRQVKGGIFAKSDIDLIKKCLTDYARSCSGDESKQIANLLHRLNNRA